MEKEAEKEEEDQQLGVSIPGLSSKKHKKRMLARQRVKRIEMSRQMISKARIEHQQHATFISLPWRGRGIDWDAIPACIAPNNFENDRGNYSRSQRKKDQCDSFFKVVERVVICLEKSLGRVVRVVDFGSGSGNSSLPLIWQMCVVVWLVGFCFSSLAHFLTKGGRGMLNGRWLIVRLRV